MSASMTPQQKADRNRLFLTKMLDLPNPQITDKMLGFLNGEGVCEVLVSFITQVDETKSGCRPERENEVSDTVRRSYVATMLLAGADPTGAAIQYVTNNFSIILPAIFKIFSEHSCGVLAHGLHLINYLITEDMDQVYAFMQSDLDATLGSALAMAEYGLVSIFILRLLRGSDATAGARIRFIMQLTEWKFFLKITDRISPIYASSHVDGVADLFLQIIDICAADSSCEMLIQPLGYCPELVGSLMALLQDGNLNSDNSQYAGRPRPSLARCSYGSRRAAAKVLQGLVTKCGQVEVEVPTLDLKCKMSNDHVFLPVSTVPNQLNRIREPLFNMIKKDVKSVVMALAGGSGGYQQLENAKLSAKSAGVIATLSPIELQAEAVVPVKDVDGDQVYEDIDTPHPINDVMASPSPNKTKKKKRSSRGGQRKRGSRSSEAGHGQPHQKQATVICHPGGFAASPLSEFRLSLVVTLASLIEQDRIKEGANSNGEYGDDDCDEDNQFDSGVSTKVSLVDELPHEIWRILPSLFFNYPLSDLFHNQVYRIFLEVIRSAPPSEKGLSLLVQKCKFVHHLVSTLSPSLSQEADVGHADLSNPKVFHCLRLCNAIRLQADSLPPSAFLRMFLQSHETWRAFLPLLLKVTLAMVKKKNSFLMKANKSIVNKKTRRRGADLSDDDSDSDSDDGLSDENKMRDDSDNAPPAVLDTTLIDLGSEYAASLGFDESITVWLDASSESLSSNGAKGLKAASRSSSFSSSMLVSIFSSSKKKKKNRNQNDRPEQQRLNFDDQGADHHIVSSNVRESLSLPPNFKIELNEP